MPREATEKTVKIKEFLKELILKQRSEFTAYDIAKQAFRSGLAFKGAKIIGNGKGVSERVKINQYAADIIWMLKDDGRVEEVREENVPSSPRVKRIYRLVRKLEEVS